MSYSEADTHKHDLVQYNGYNPALNTRGFGLHGLRDGELEVSGLGGWGDESMYEPSGGSSWGGGGGGGDWGGLLQSLIRTGVSTVSNIVTSRFAVPPAGTVITSPAGQIIRTVPGATTGVGISPFGSAISSNTLLLLGGGLLLVMVLKKR